MKKEEGKHRRQGKELEHIHTGQGDVQVDVVMEYEVGTEAEEAMEHNVDVVA